MEENGCLCRSNGRERKKKMKPPTYVHKEHATLQIFREKKRESQTKTLSRCSSSLLSTSCIWRPHPTMLGNCCVS